VRLSAFAYRGAYRGRLLEVDTIMQTQTPERPIITRKVRWLYGIGAAAYGVKDNGFSYFLLFYYNQVLDLPGT
jgi:hypothetical protein